MAAKKEIVNVMGRRWDTSRANFFSAPVGLSLQDIVEQSLDSAYKDKIYTKEQHAVLSKYARCRLNGVEIDRKYWAVKFPEKGDRIEILHGVRGGGGGGGGGGKNPIATVLKVLVVVVAAAATFWAGGAGAAIPFGLTAAQFTTGVALVAGGLLMAIDMLFPAKPPKMGGMGGLSDASAEKSSPTYSINGGKNAHNTDGYVPLILGRHRITPPLGAKSWTYWAGDDQYFNMLVVWGHEHITVSDFRIGDTALSKFAGVEHVFHQSTTGKGLKFFGWQYNEENVGATLTTGWTTRTVGVGTGFSVDVNFPGGLCNINKNNGNKEWRRVNLELQYKPTNGGSWKGFPVTITRSFSSKTIDTGANKQPIGVSQAGNVHVGNGYRNLWPSKTAGVSGGGVTWRHKSRWVINTYYYYDYSDGWWRQDYTRVKQWYWEATVASGSFQYNTSGSAEVNGAKNKRLVRSYRVTGLPSKSYDVRIRRTSAESNDSYIIDTCQWEAMRAITQKPAFETPIPICVSELRIKASEQLSGYVTEFSAICHSKLPDWTPPTKTAKGHWNTWRNTRNPASIMRYLLTSKHSLIKPFPVSRLDNASLVDLWNWCSKNGYTFDFVADSEENLWARLMSVLAPAMAGPTTDVDGLWGAVIDKPDKTVRQMFTPRNSWGINIQRGFARLPDAMRIKFVDEADDWKQKEGFVYNDGFNKDGSGGKKKANDVIEWSFEGVTNWNRMYKLARYHLAQTLHRQMTVTLNTDWEWLAVHRGDLVGLSSDVLMNTFGTARVQRLVYLASTSVDDPRLGYINDDEIRYIDTEGVEEYIGPGQNPSSGAAFVGIEIDDTVYFSSPKPARYGIAIRNSNGSVNILELKPLYGQESSVLYFSNRDKAKKTPPKCGDLVSISLLGSEYEEYLVSAINPGDNMSAQLTLIPYKAKEIYAAATKAIPAYAAPVVLDQNKGAADLPTPTLKSVVSDERVAKILASGAVEICIGGVWSLPPTTENLAYFTVQITATDVETGAAFTGTSGNGEEYAVCPGVEVGRTYAVKVRIHDPRTGRQSAWSNIINHKVAGLVLPPPTPQNVRATAFYPQGIKLIWDAVNVIDLRRYVIKGATEGKTTAKECEYVYAPTKQSGKLTYQVYAIDTTDHLSSQPGTASFTVNPPQKPVVSLARLENEGIVLTYADAQGTWPVDHYESQCLNKAGESKTLRCVVPFPDSFRAGEKAKVRGVDAFGNAGAWSDLADVAVVPPLMPEVTIETNAGGTAVFRWQNCRTVTDIKHYILEGASKGSTTDTYAVLDVQKILWETIGEGENQYRKGSLAEYVTAIDKWGIASARGAAELEVWPPYNPLVNVEKRTDGLYLTWQDCRRTFVISYYIVKDLALNLEYKIDGTSQALKPRAAGSYQFSVQAFDCLGIASEEMIAAQSLGGVGAVAPTAAIDGSDILLTWDVPDSSWPLDYYLIRDKANVDIGRSKTTTFRFPAPRAGSYEYSVVGRDIAGNWGPDGTRAAITVNAPAAPAVAAVLDGEGVTASWESGGGTNTLPIVAWDVVRQWEETENGQTVTKEQDYGRLDVTSLTVPAMKVGRHWFLVRGVDTAGVTGAWGDAHIDVSAPGKVTFVNQVCIDNNVMLYWSTPDKIYFPIEYYLFEKRGEGDMWEEIGRIDALFASTFEASAGLYDYAITPVDIAGNLGTRVRTMLQVSQPPDFILYHDYDSLFNGGNCAIGRNQPDGGRVRFVLDHEGHMIGPWEDRTWNENLSAIEAAKEKTAADVTWQDKVGWGWDRWLDPASSSAVYTEIVDVTGEADALIPSTTILVTIDSTPLDGDPSFACQIETSVDGQTWIVISDDAFMVHAGEFRFVRYTITLTGGTASISNINYRLDVKRKTDFGQIYSDASDNDEDYVDDVTTPMLKGTFVPFNVAFADISSLPKPNVVNHPELTAYTIFEDAMNPEGFRVFILNDQGVRVSGTVDWAAYGV